MGGEAKVPVALSVPGLVEIQGYRNITIDRAAGRFVSITVWDTPEHAQAFPTAIAHLLGKFVAASLQPEPTQLFAVTREV